MNRLMPCGRSGSLGGGIVQIFIFCDKNMEFVVKWQYENVDFAGIDQNKNCDFAGNEVR
jgi:hypothetical protein